MGNEKRRVVGGQRLALASAPPPAADSGMRPQDHDPQIKKWREGREFQSLGQVRKVY